MQFAINVFGLNKWLKVHVDKWMLASYSSMNKQYEITLNDEWMSNHHTITNNKYKSPTVAETLQVVFNTLACRAMVCGGRLRARWVLIALRDQDQERHLQDTDRTLHDFTHYIKLRPSREFQKSVVNMLIHKWMPLRMEEDLLSACGRSLLYFPLLLHIRNFRKSHARQPVMCIGEVFKVMAFYRLRGG